MKEGQVIKDQWKESDKNQSFLIQYKYTSFYNSMKLNGGTPVKVDAKKAEILKRKLKEFKDIFDQEMASFAASPQLDYYIVSKQYLDEWVRFCESNDAQRVEPRPMNEDLMDAGGQLRKGLVQSKDFEIINEKVYALIKGDKGFELRRSAVFVGKQKRVPIYLDLIKYVKLDHKDVHGIDYKKIHAEDLKMKLIQISKQDTMGRLLRKIIEAEGITSRYKVRVWKNNVQDYGLTKLFKYIKEKTEKLSYYRFDGVGKHIEDEETVLEDLNLEEGDYFIAEVSDEYSGWFFKSPDEAKCQGCYKYKKLPYVCGCKVVAYCTIECQEKDKRYHIKDCKFAEEQELNQEIEMNMTSASMLGRVGLSNLGNTCFMNSCLQCLSNTTLLTDYFLRKYFDKEINKDNPLGSKGRLARNYAKFIKNMWCGSESTFSPHNLKGAVAKLNPIFSGYAQHDSQEFFSFLVDGLHEDLNRVLKKPYVESVDSKNRPDEIVAMQSWIAYTQRNQSIIVDLITGQYKSKVICPTCNIESITFDPFTTVSLPIPEEPTVSDMKFYVIFNDNEKEALRMSFQYTKANTKEWLETATSMLKRNPEDFVFYVLTIMENIYGFESSSKAEIIHKIEEQNKNVFLLELSEQEKKMKERVEIVTRLCKKSYHFNEYDNLWFKRPFFFEKSTTKGVHIYTRILRYLFPVYSNKKEFKSYQDYQAKMLNEKPFTLVLKSKKSLERYYGRVETKFDKELVIDQMDATLTEILQGIAPNDYQLDVRFSKDSVKLFEFDRLKKCSDGEEKTIKKSSYKEQASVSLDDCFRVFEEKEQLEPGNEWYCPKCKQHRLATKQMTIYKAPQILILHLKRFKNKGTYRKEKNETSVKFPMVLNLKSFVIDPKPMSSYISSLKKQEKYCEPSFQVEYENSQPEYELYAISNHYGGLGGGHYTAYGKNKDKWYEFNDSSVHSVGEGELKGSGAYMLFYRRINSMKIK